MALQQSRLLWQLRLFVAVLPGALVIFAGLLAYSLAIQDPELDFGKKPLLITTVAGLAVACLGYIIHRKAFVDSATTGRQYERTALFALTCVVVFPAVLMLGLDEVMEAGMWFSAPRPLLIMRPNSTEAYQTAEFSFTATTNSLGFRDREIDLARKRAFRVLAIGDSFTSGWGVGEDEAWPKVVERRLRAQGLEIEVINLGCPGAGPDAYADVAESIIPLCSPDLVIVGVLQGIDLKLLTIGPTSDRLYQSKVADRLRQRQLWSRALLPGLSEFLIRRESHRSVNVSAEENRESWRKMTDWMARRLTPGETQRFNALDEQVKTMYRAGDLSPWEVYFALKYPDYLSFALQSDSDDVQVSARALTWYLSQIQSAADEVKARTIVLSIPPAWYFSPRALASKRKVGYRLDDKALDSTAPDELIRSACQEAGIECLSYRDRFRKIGSEEVWFYDFDGMYNAKGHAILGEEVAKSLSGLIH